MLPSDEDVRDGALCREAEEALCQVVPLGVLVKQDSVCRVPKVVALQQVAQAVAPHTLCAGEHNNGVLLELLLHDLRAVHLSGRG